MNSKCYNMSHAHVLIQNEKRGKTMNFIKQKGAGILVCLAIAVPSWLLGKIFPIVGGAIFAILLGMILTLFWKEKGRAEAGIKWTSKTILQTGKQSLPIIICTISTSLVVAWILHKVMHIESNISTLIGVGSSICGGSAVAATAPVIDADDDEVAQAISVIFFFNVLAAILFPILGSAIGMSTTNGEAFGVFAGTAVNDTSSVTAAASTWDSMWHLGGATLEKAVMVKLTRTLAIIPITFGLALLRGRKKQLGSSSFSLKRAFPMFILYFLLAAVVTTICLQAGAPAAVFAPVKELSKFFIIMAMAAIGLNSNLVKLIKTGGKPILLGACCWLGITLISLFMQHMLNLW